LRTPGKEYVQEFTNYPRNVLEYGLDEGSKVHPTQKPVALMEYLIRTYTNPGDTVLDNCMGSGTTGVACVNTGRSFIGIEKDEAYFALAKQRIEDRQRLLAEVLS
jgi:site-specific DNA-methyltransferase (adenine-specific)